MDVSWRENKVFPWLAFHSGVEVWGAVCSCLSWFSGLRLVSSRSLRSLKISDLRRGQAALLKSQHISAVEPNHNTQRKVTVSLHNVKVAASGCCACKGRNGRGLFWFEDAPCTFRLPLDHTGSMMMDHCVAPGKLQ